MKNKLLSILLSTSMVVSLAACGSSNQGAETTTSDAAESTEAADSAKSDESGETASEETAESNETASDYELTDLYITDIRIMLLSFLQQVSPVMDSILML